MTQLTKADEKTIQDAINALRESLDQFTTESIQRFTELRAAILKAESKGGPA